MSACISSDYIQATNIILEIRLQSPQSIYDYIIKLHPTNLTLFSKVWATRFICHKHAKNTEWDSRLNNLRGKELLNAIHYNNWRAYLLAYWFDQDPWCLRFLHFQRHCESKLQCLDISSDHSPIIISYKGLATRIPDQLPNSYRFTNWVKFQNALKRSPQKWSRPE